MRLNETEKKILKKVRDLEEPTATTIHKQKEFKEGLTENTIRNYLNNLTEDYELLDYNGYRPKVYEINDDGYEKLKSIKRQEKQEDIEEKDGLDYADMVYIFEEFFNENYAEKISEISLGNKTLKIDYSKLEKHNYELADKLVTSPDTFLDAGNEAIREITNASHNVDFRVSNLPDIETRTISEISADHQDRFISVEGVIQGVGKNQAKVDSAVFECTQCGDEYIKEQDSTKLQSPYKCDCGSRQFKTVERNTKNHRMIKLKDKPDAPGDDTIRVVFDGELSKGIFDLLKNNGLAVKINGYLNLDPNTTRGGGESALYDYYVKANSYEILDSKWGDIEVTQEDKDEINELKESNSLDEWVEIVRNSIAKDVSDAGSMALMKEAVINYLLGRGLNEEDNNLHCLVIGDPGLAKSQVLTWIDKTVPKTIKSSGTGSTGVGLTATVRKDEFTGDYVADAGAIPQANGGYHLTDEIDKVDDSDAVKMNDALSEGYIHLNKANINKSIPANISEFAIGNPEDSTFDPHKDRVGQIPIDKSEFVRRYGVKIAMLRSDIDREEHEEIVETVLDMNETDSQLSDKLFVKLMVLAQEKNPELSDEVKQKIKQIYLQLQDAGKEDSKYLSAEFFDPTRIQTVKLMSISYARLDLSDTVEIEHLERANKMLRKYYKTYGFEFGKDSTDEFNLDLRESNRIKKFNELVDSKFVIDSEIEFADIVETYKEENQDLEDISKSKVEEKVEELAEKSDKYYLQDQNLHKHE